MLATEDGRVKHFPRNPQKFEFDKEVTAAFPDMAVRSIPNYEEAHRLHVSLLRPILEQGEVIVCDIGASRGHFFKEICNQLQIPTSTGSPLFTFIAVDSSAPMMEALHEEMPWVCAVVADARNMVDLEEPADIISMFYVLQFIEEDADKLLVLQWASRNLKPGGVLLLGQKEEVSSTYLGMFTDEYYQFRMNNGYSIEEIRAKTVALSHSMWPSSPSWLESLCYSAGFIDYVETTKWLQFSTSMCVR